MTENKRVFLNVIASYGRSLYALAIGLFCGRWTLMTLGHVDYGLFGLIGGLIGFITFFNSVFANANARFYAHSIGAAKVAADPEAGLEECRAWFNTALTIHTVVPILAIVVGYPIGIYAIEHWLTIPIERIDACRWVFRFACFAGFVGMVNVPFTAMYNAKQYIAELTIYSFVTSTLNAFVLYFMVTHPRDWLVLFAGWTCIVGVTPQIIIAARAFRLFPECKIRLRYLGDLSRMGQLGSFAGWQFFGMVCGLMQTQGMMVAVNKFFGPAMNAAQAIGTTVQGHCNTLASAMHGAFVPVITQACGAGDYAKMNKFALRTCKFNVLLSSIFMIPLALELPEVMHLWLKNPPEYAAGLCFCAMLSYVACYCTLGLMVEILATGKIALYHVVLGAVAFLSMPLSVGVGYLTRNIYAMMAVLVVMECVNSVGRILFAKKLCGTRIRDWVLQVFVPLTITISAVAGIGYLPHLWAEPSFLRIIQTTIICESVFLPLAWFLVLSEEERQFVQEKVVNRLRKVL